MKDGWVENRRDGVTPCPIVIDITHMYYDVSVRVRRCDWGVVLWGGCSDGGWASDCKSDT